MNKKVRKHSSLRRLYFPATIVSRLVNFKEFCSRAKNRKFNRYPGWQCLALSHQGLWIPLIRLIVDHKKNILKKISFIIWRFNVINFVDSLILNDSELWTVEYKRTKKIKRGTSYVIIRKLIGHKFEYFFRDCRQPLRL